MQRLRLYYLQQHIFSILLLDPRPRLVCFLQNLPLFQSY